MLQRRYRNAKKCIKSRAAILILFLNFIIHLLCYSFLNLSNIYVFRSALVNLLVDTAYNALVDSLYPVAGLLADNKYGRYKMMVFSSWIHFPGLITTIVGGVLILITKEKNDAFMSLTVTGFAFVSVGFLLLTIGIIGFAANIIQFGLDQLFDSPSEDQVVFLYWYMWSCYMARLVYIALVKTKDLIHFKSIYYALVGVILILITVSLVILLLIARSKKIWFFIDSRRPNPYRIVYQVTKYAHRHKVPVNRSAFTYCEDEIPSGLDLGKTKYGGPFTTEQVEDVKVFYGILKVIFGIGPIFYLHYCSDSMNAIFKVHSGTINALQDVNLTTIMKVKEIFIDTLTYHLITAVAVPSYIIFIRPYISYYIPGILKRMGLGILVMIIPVVWRFVIETMVHLNNDSMHCVFIAEIIKSHPCKHSPMQLVNASSKVEYFQYIDIIFFSFSNIAIVFIYVTLYEFICSQSPHTMTGLLIGLSFAVRGFYQLLGILLAMLFLTWHGGKFPSCGMIYYIIVITLGLLSFAFYVCIARGYQYRVRDEPCHVRRYVEEYYSKTEQEEFYDYY